MNERLPAGATGLRTKASLLLVTIALLPAGLVGWLLADANRDAIETSERSTQAAVLKEIAGETLRSIGSVRDDAEAVALVLSIVSASDETSGAPIDTLRSVLASRKHLNAARFEVPSANVSTVIRLASKSRAKAPENNPPSAEGSPSAQLEPPSAEREATKLLVPESTERLRSIADQRGVAFQLLDAERGLVVVPIPESPGQSQAGYVTVVANMARLRDELQTAAATRFDGESLTVLVADGDRRLVASVGAIDQQPGEDISQLGVWNALGPDTPWTSRVAVISSFDGQSVRMLGGVETVPELGWATAMYRPEREAYQALSELQRSALLVGAAAVLFALTMGVVVGRSVTKPILQMVARAKLIGRRQWSRLSKPLKRRDELGALDRSLAEMAEQLQVGEKEIAHQSQIRSNLSRFMTQPLVEQIVEGKHSLSLGGERRDVSVLFADVVAFTPMAESRDAEQVVGLLNELFSVLSEVVFRHEGTVDKFVGDCIMAVWGAPLDQPDHRHRALMAAEDMMRLLQPLNQTFSERLGTEVRLAIGINSGESIVGNIGSDKRMEYTVIGDVVNVAARLETLAAPNQILVAEGTAEALGQDFVLTDLGEKNLMGRKTATRLFQLEYEV